MNKKICFIGFSSLLLIIGLLSVPLILAQAAWYSVKISAYGNNFEEGRYSGLSLEFTVADPPSGLEVNNTISATPIILLVKCLC